MLYLVATPIGNLGDMTLRALETLRSVDVIACEDTRTSGRLLQHFEIRKPLISFHEHNEQQAGERIFGLLAQGKSVAVISDAGTPGVSDPGFTLVRRSLDEHQELAYYVVHARRSQAQLKRLVQIAGRRWEIEIGFEATKGECGLDHYEVRRWQGWYRHITLALLAHAVLVALRVREKKTHTRPDCPERARVA